MNRLNYRSRLNILAILALVLLVGVGLHPAAAQGGGPAAQSDGTADLALTLKVDRHQARPGQNIVFIMTIKNHGPTTARDVVFSKHVPDPLNPVAFFCVPPATLDGSDCRVSNLAPGEEATGIAVLTPIGNPAPDERQFTTFANVSAATPDPNERNNTDTVRIRIVGVDRADLVAIIPPLGGGDFCVPVGEPPRTGIAFTVQNQGVRDAPASVALVEFFGVAVSVPIPAIPAGGSVDPPPVVTSPGCFRSDCSFTITVDATNRVNESDENNNSTRGRCLG